MGSKVQPGQLVVIRLLVTVCYLGKLLGFLSSLSFRAPPRAVTLPRPAATKHQVKKHRTFKGKKYMSSDNVYFQGECHSRSIEALPPLPPSLGPRGPQWTGEGTNNPTPSIDALPWPSPSTGSTPLIATWTATNARREPYSQHPHRCTVAPRA
ncbi:hypothetical protein ACHAWF_007644 [Thalassiosira exigua]